MYMAILKYRKICNLLIGIRVENKILILVTD